MPLSRRFLLALALAGGAATSALAQTGTAQTSPAPLLPPIVTDSVPVIGIARIRVITPRVQLDSIFVTYLVEAIRQHFHAPTTVALNALSVSMPDDSGAADDTVAEPFPRLPKRVVPRVGAEVLFTVRPDRAPSDVAVLPTVLDADLERSLYDAVRALTPDDYPPFPPGMREVRLRVRLTTRSASPKEQQPFFAMRLPVYTLEKAVERERSTRSPEFPEIARQSGVGDTVVVSFVVGPDGRPVPGTVAIRRGGYREFIDSILAWLSRDARFLPAVANGAPAAIYVTQPFMFRLGP